MKEDKSEHQTFILPKDEMTLNLANADPSMLRIRLINIDKETKKINDQNQFRDEEVKNINYSEDYRNISD